MGTEMDVDGLFEFEKRFKELAKATRLVMKPSSPMARAWIKMRNSSPDTMVREAPIENGMIRLA